MTCTDGWSLVRSRISAYEKVYEKVASDKPISQNVLRVSHNVGHVKVVKATFEELPHATIQTSTQKLVQPLIHRVAPCAEPEGFLEDQQHMPADPVVSEQPHKNLYAVDEDDEDFQEALEAEQVALALRTPSKPIAASAAPIEMNADFVWEERCPSVNLEASRAWALYAEGQNAHFGFGAVPDLAKAEDCFRRSAQLGHTEAAYDLGLLLLHKGKPTQKESSLMWWKMAAQKGHIKAQEAHDQYIKSALRQANSKFSGFSVFDSFMSFCLESTKGSFVN